VPRVLVLERDGAHLVERHTLTGEEQAGLTLLFPLTLSPSALT
jgi:hypothetical protein